MLTILVNKTPLVLTGGALPMKANLEALLESGVNLPTLPGAAARIVQLANDPGANVQTLARLLAMDPALTTKVLRYVNSPAYAKTREIESLKQAVVIMGLDATISLALSFSLLPSLQKQEGGGLDYPLFWRRSLLAATAARSFGRGLPGRPGEELFLAALMQDIGMLVLDRLPERHYADIGAGLRDHRRLQERERAKLGQDHATIGASLLRKWGLPERIAVAVEHSHSPEAPVADEYLAFARCVAVSGAVADIFINDDTVAAYASAATLASVSLQMDAAHFGDLVQELSEQMPELEAMFKVGMECDEGLTALLDQAREALVTRHMATMRVVDELQGTAASLELRTRKLEESSRRDGLTGLYNRAYLDACLPDLLAHAKRRRRPLCLAFADIDHFKAINDGYGHTAGDMVLKAAGHILTSSLRSSDIVVRYGGEEFVIVLPDTDLEQAQAICERIVRGFSRRAHPVARGREVPVTISIGLASAQRGGGYDDAQALIAAADAALYRAKEEGRNRLAVDAGGLLN